MRPVGGEEDQILRHGRVQAAAVLGDDVARQREEALRWRTRGEHRQRAASDWSEQRELARVPLPPPELPALVLVQFLDLYGSSFRSIHL